MIRVFVVMTSAIMSVTFALPSFANEIQPRLTQCPNCGSFSVRQTIVGEEEQGLTKRACIHYVYGEDYLYPIYNIWRESCMDCSYMSDTWR